MSALATIAHHLGQFDHDARLLDIDTFMALHGEAFFVHYGALKTLTAAGSMRGTMVNEALRVDGSWQHEYFVFRLRKAPGQPTDTPVSIGRTGDNDVIIPDASLSRRHALVQPSNDSPETTWLIQDLGSTNGTLVDDTPVEREHPTRIQPGSRVKLGNVDLTFLLAREFCALVRRLGPEGI